MSGTNTWFTSTTNGRYYYDHQPSHLQLQVQLQTPSNSTTTESSPISPQQFVDWFGHSSVEPPYVSHHTFFDPMVNHGVYVEAPEEVESEAEQEQEEEQEEEQEREVTTGGTKRERDASDADESEPTSPAPTKRRRRRSGDDGERRSRSSRACLVCRGFKAKCMPGPSGRKPDEESPCSRCSANGHSCEFTVNRRGKYPTKKFARLQKQLEHMERMHHLLDQALRLRARRRSRQTHTHYLI